jgi:penicillin-binding protein 1A
MNTLFQKIRSSLSAQSKWYRRIVKAIWIISICIVVFLPLYIFAVIQNPFDLFGEMPSLKAIENPENDLSSEVISSDGVSLGKYFRYNNRSQVSYDQLPDKLVKTLIISEDHRFFDHSGMDFVSFLRVAKGILTLSSQGGGSTLTQQTAKNLFSTRGEELQGKLASIGKPVELLISKTKEWIIATQLETNFTKEEIIALYLNTVPFNNGAFGVKVAAETYFNKNLDELTLEECALLVGMLQGTYRFNPIDFPERSIRKRNEVIEKLYVHGYLKSEQERDSIQAIPLKLNFAVQSHNEGLATYFRSVMRSYLLAWCKENGYDLLESGLKIYVTLDSRMQAFAEEAMREHMKNLQHEFDQSWGKKNPWVNADGEEIKDFLERHVKRTDTYKNLVARFGAESPSIKTELNRVKRMKVFGWDGIKDVQFSTMDSLRYYNKFLQSGLMAMNPQTGEVKAWVGGINHRFFQFDHVFQAKRQAGSTFKPFVYGKAIEDGHSPCLELYDISPTINVNGTIYHVKNFNNTFGDGQPYTIRQAMARSLNTVTIQLMDKLKPQNVADFAKKMGITTPLDPVHPLALGTSDVSLYEMVGAYSAFANLGLHTLPHYITRIEDKHGNVIASFVPKSKQVIGQDVAYTMVHMFKGGVEEDGGTSRVLSAEVLSDNEVGGKTGTTNDASDGWYIGMTHNLVTGVWVGAEDRNVHLPPGLGSGSRSALPLWDKFMQQVYRHPEVGYRKGTFKQPVELPDITFDCDKYDDDDITLVNE